MVGNFQRWLEERKGAQLTWQIIYKMWYSDGYGSIGVLELSSDRRSGWDLTAVYSRIAGRLGGEILAKVIWLEVLQRIVGL